AAAMPGRLFDERIEHDLRIDDTNAICGAVVFLPELFDKLVLTTNLDDLLERMYELRNRRFSHILAGKSISEYRKVKANSERVLLKFHGDCRSRDGRVLGKTEYEQAYCNGSPIKEELTTVYRNHSILCLGCSLEPDRTVELLAEVAKIDPGMPKHYAFLQHPNNADMLRQREHFLTDRDVFPIWYRDYHDESIKALFVGMMQHLGRL
ncbi:MAG: SIR2 family protein, partial [Desulfobacterium sp.]|nr:SIR2 family protein [Desulfobacterium sp.]MBU4036666.1 SIR2 family protein [Pseudomonadota bacterium]